MVQATQTPRKLWCMGYPRGYSAPPRNTLGISHTPHLPWGLSITYRTHFEGCDWWKADNCGTKIERGVAERSQEEKAAVAYGAWTHRRKDTRAYFSTTDQCTVSPAFSSSPIERGVILALDGPAQFPRTWLLSGIWRFAA